MKKILFVTAAALIDSSNHVLLAQRPVGKDMAGLWEFPGGKIHEDETPEEALAREIKEELDLTLQVEDLEPLSFASHDYPDFHLFMPLYLCRTWQGEVKALEEQAFAWVAIEDLGAHDMPPADVPLVAALKKAL